MLHMHMLEVCQTDKVVFSEPDGVAQPGSRGWCYGGAGGKISAGALECKGGGNLSDDIHTQIRQTRDS